MPPLINRQWEQFCISYFGGKTKQDAAIEAGYSHRSAGVAASRLLRIDKVLARLKELQEEAASAKIMSVREREERLSAFGREDIRSEKGALIRHGSISAIAELNKMQGSYAPARMEIAGQSGGPIQIEDTRARLLSVLEAVAKRLESEESIKQG